MTMWIEELHKPLPGTDPDRVPQDTIAQELALFDGLGSAPG